MPPMISVIMPVYNAEKHVALAIESILNQTYINFEFIIIDDCSVDNSYSMLQEYAAKDKRIKLLKNLINLKIPETLSLGIFHATGKYIARMDADDISLPDRFNKQIEFMESNPAIGVCGTNLTVFNENNNYHNVKHPECNLEIKITLLFQHCCIAHPTVMLRRDIFTSSQMYYDPLMQNSAEDYDLWIRLLNYGIRFYNIPETLLMYRESSEQITNIRKNSIEDHTKNLLYSNFSFYFGHYISKEKIMKFIELTQNPKKQLQIVNFIFYLYILKSLKYYNKINKLFDVSIFNKVLNQRFILFKLKRLFLSS